MDLYDNVKFTEESIDNITDEATDWANTHGIVMRNRKDLRLNNFAPFTLFPSPFPEYLYKEAFDVHKHFQSLMLRCSRDHGFLESSLKSVIVHDEFTRKLYNIYNIVREEGIKQPITVDLMRNDYMLDDKRKTSYTNGHNVNGSLHREFEIKQIEINMIASSFSGLGSQTCKLHRHISDVLMDKSPIKNEKLPPNDTIVGLGRGLAEAWKLYGNESATLLFIVQAGEKNRYDQRLLQYSFQERIKEFKLKRYVPIIFKSLGEIFKEGKLTEDHRLIIGDHEVAVAYFRAGYTPNDYITENCWKARLLIERSKAIKSPNIAAHLVGSKKIQQVLSAKGSVERFIKDPEAVKKIRRTFAGLYSLDEGQEGDQAAKMALANPENFVLKPQREGGGNNYYGEELVSVLKAIKDPVERSQYILMDKVNPPVYKNFIVHIEFDRPKLLDVVNEIGVFGILISNDGNEVINESVGYLVRTKSIEHADGGVAAGRAVLDSISLF
ncbi:glutathione synthetase-like [Rhopilema esculentum]|uniref:glutathione synthetase-like n=1 Tax=Rhopilema esculentum TaxID=499914 RepID=UPI0031E32B33